MSNILKQKHSFLIKNIAKALGFDFVGISKAGFLEKEAPRLEKWLKNNMHGKMQYMENHFDKRLNPQLLVDGAKSVVSLLYNYYPEKDLNNEKFKIAKYAYGEDYHEVIKLKLKEFLYRIEKEIGQVSGRAFVDSAPVMDKVWAQKSGLGWIGKNSNLINKNSGSFFFIAELIIDLDLEPDGPIKDYCGTCTRCIDACPTNAITPYIVDGSKCISYFTIELKEEIPQSEKGKFENWVFGCDICQDVCPWNRFSKAHHEPAFNPLLSIENFSEQNWTEMTEEIFLQLFKKSPLKRSKLKGIQRNIEFLKKQ